MDTKLHRNSQIKSATSLPSEHIFFSIVRKLLCILAVLPNSEEAQAILSAYLLNICNKYDLKNIYINRVKF